MFTNVLSFVGTLAGGVLLKAAFDLVVGFRSEQREDRLRWVTERRDTYIDFLVKTKEAWDAASYLNAHASLGQITESKKKETYDTTSKVKDLVYRSLTELELLGSGAAASCGQSLFDCVRDEVNIAIANLNSKPKIDLKTIDERTEQYYEARKKFKNEARKDLGVRGRLK